jgi:hypothetical protein
MMLDQVGIARTVPRSVRRALALGFAGVGLAIVIAISAAVLVPIDSCACATPADLIVQNYSQRDASVTWSQPGLFGSPLRGLSGDAVATACRTLTAGLRSGIVDVAVESAGVRRSFQVHVREAVGDGPAVIVIGVDGGIADPIYDDPPGGYRQLDLLC